MKDLVRLASPSPVSDIDREPADIEALARKLYVAHTDNHPTIHCNRFQSWSKLNRAQQSEWVAKACDQLDEAPAPPAEGGEREG